MSKLNEEVAVEVMGWELFGDDDPWFRDLRDADTKDYIMPGDDWKPDQDRDQSRMVVEKAVEVCESLGFTDAMLLMTMRIGDLMGAMKKAWIRATPEQECDAALMAVRKAREPKP